MLHECFFCCRTVDLTMPIFFRCSTSPLPRPFSRRAHVQTSWLYLLKTFLIELCFLFIAVCVVGFESLSGPARSVPSAKNHLCQILQSAFPHIIVVNPAYRPPHTLLVIQMSSLHGIIYSSYFLPEIFRIL